jgi:DNA-directed RNA polymerase subunit RPC12/RpoP
MEYRCDHCNKKYSSYQSLWIHNKKYHTIKNIDSTGNVLICTGNVLENKSETTNYKCKYCKKIFKSRQNKWDHEKNNCKKIKY